MRRVHEYEVWSIPGGLLPPEYGKTTLQHAVWDQGVSRDVFIGLSEIPGPVHCHNLQCALRSGELKLPAFEAFCREFGLAANADAQDSAAKYLEFAEGRPLAWVHIPENSDPKLLGKIVALMHERGHIVIDPADGSRIP